MRQRTPSDTRALRTPLGAQRTWPPCSQAGVSASGRWEKGVALAWYKSTMRVLPRLAIVAPLALASLVLPACPEQPAEGEGEGEEGEGEGEPSAVMALLETHLVDTDVDVAITAGFALALRPDGRFAVAYGRNQSANTVECNQFGGGTITVDAWDLVVVDEQADGTFRTRVVDSVPPMPAAVVDVAADPTSGALILAYTGGDPANGACQGSDLRLAVESGDTFTLSTINANAPTGAPCREVVTQQVCNQGDCVGKNPGVAVGADGNVAITWIDEHFCFGDTDIYKSDLEIATGPTGGLALNSVATETGSGWNNTVTIADDGSVLVAYQTLGNTTVYDDPVAGTGPAHDVPDGIYASVSQADGTFNEVLLFERASTTSRVATAHRGGSGYYVAWQDQGTDQLLLYNSVDNGETWTPGFIEQTGNTGKDPAIAFLSDGTFVAAYGHCKDRDDGTQFCSQAQDGVRIAFREPGGAFIRTTFTGDDEDTDGTNVDMAVAADDTVVVLSFNASTSRVVVQRFQKQ